MKKKKYSIFIVISVIFFLAGVIGIYFISKIQLEKQVRKKLNKQIAQISPYADISYKAVKVNPIGRKIIIKDISIKDIFTGQKISIDEVIIHSYDYKHKVPHFLNASIKEIEINIDDILKSTNDNYVRESCYFMKSIDYSTISAGLFLDYKYDPKEEQLLINRLAIEAKDLGSLVVKIQVNNFNPNMLSSSSINTGPITPALILKKATITYRDNSFTPRIIKKVAENRKVTKEEYKKSLIQGLETSLKKETTPVIRELLVALKNFISEPECISFTAGTNEPIGKFMRYLSRQQLEKAIDFLNIHITNQCEL
jgi:hypothetical protein